MKVTCPECQETLQVEDRQAGSSIQCPSCFGRIEIPLVATPAATASQSPGQTAETPASQEPLKFDFDQPDDLDLPVLFEVTELPAPTREVTPAPVPSPVRSAAPPRPSTAPKPATKSPTLPPPPVSPPRSQVAATSPPPPAAEQQMGVDTWDRILGTFEGAGPLSVRVLKKVGQIVGQATSQTGSMVRFYYTRRIALLFRSPAWDWFGLSTINAYRELIIPPTDLVADTWQVVLPACCVVCGLDTDNPPQHESRSVDDVGPTVWILVGQVPVSAYVWWNYGPWWMAAVVLAAVIWGYGCYRSQPVEIEFCRCDKHCDAGRYPELFLISEGLLVRTGQRRVKREYRRLQQGGEKEFTPPAPGDESDYTSRGKE